MLKWSLVQLLLYIVFVENSAEPELASTKQKWYVYYGFYYSVRVYVCVCNMTDELKKAIERDFGSIENMKMQLSAMSVAVQGSGWGWLGYNRQTSRLQLATTFNQDLLEPTAG